MLLCQNLTMSMRAIRQQRFWSVNAMANHLQIARSTAQTILSGCCNPRISTVEQIAGQLGVSPLSLLSPGFDLEAAVLSLQTDAALDGLPPAQRAALIAHLLEMIQILGGRSL